MPETAAAGATPAAGGATPPQTPDSPAPATTVAPATPATGEPDADGMTTDAGRTALRKERDRAEKAERELDKLRKANQTETERAIADAKAAGAAEATEKYAGAIRRAAVKASLLEAGVDPSLIELASRAEQFARLDVDEDGEVKGLDGALEAFKRTTPSVFVKPGPKPTDSGLGPRGAPAASGSDMNTLIRRAAGRA